MKKIILTGLIIVFAFTAFNNTVAQDQKKDKGTFIESKNEFMDEIKKGIKDFNTKPENPELNFKLDYSSYKNLPKSINEFKCQWANDPVSQGNTGTCWCFSTTSFFETEVYRLTKKKVKISEIYTVYWEYVEKAKRYVEERGESNFAEGSEANAVQRIWKKYGCVPEDNYTGLKPGQKFHDHSKLIDEMTNYLKTVKANNSWNEDEVIATIKSILNYYLGVSPTEATIDGKKMSPQDYLNNYLKLNMDDYVDVLSLLERPYWEQVELNVEDNWWKSKEYYNVPLDDFMSAVKSVMKKGYTVCLGGDVSEPGYDSRTQCCVIPSFDIPSQYIDENARQFRFSNKTTTDDHGIHLIGYKEQNGEYWFVIKDSGSSSRNGANKGHYFYQEDYIKLKMLDFFVHRSAVEDLLAKFKK